MSIGTVLFNPFTGKPRHPDDIKSDPDGLLIWDGEARLKAAQAQQGLVMVPVEPTQEMIAAAQTYGNINGSLDPHYSYHAMLAAASKEQTK